MKRSRYRVEQILESIRRVEEGVGIRRVCFDLGISHQTYNRWRRLYQGLSLREARKLEKNLRERALMKKRLKGLQRQCEHYQAAITWLEAAPAEDG